jgi:pyruvate kinase
MDVARVNFSHGSNEEHARRIAAVRAAAEDAGQPVAILADLPGPKFRLAEISAGTRMLHEGEQVALAAGPGGATDLPVRNPEILPALAPREPVFLADGAVELRVVAPHPTRVVCEVAVGGTVRSGSGINVPDAELGSVVPTEADRRHLAFALAQSVEWIGVSFVQSADDLHRVRACMRAAGRTLLMAKIEKRRAVRDLDSVIDAADGVMVARGDLGVETDLAEIALLQKRIIATANAHSRPVVTATQMLESMIEHEHPTRAEVTDVANAVLDGTDAVMLSGETAIGRYPAAAVEMLNRVLRVTESEYAHRIAAERLRTANPGEEHALSFVACQLAQRIGARAIVALVREVAAVAALASFRPFAPIIVPAEDEPLARSLAMVRGIVPLHAATSGDSQHIAAARAWLEERALAKAGDPVIMLMGLASLQVVRL